VTPARKPAELVDPDPRWQHLVGSWADLAAAAADWPVAPGVPDEVKAILSVARELFVHSYFVYEFSVVAVAWSLFAVEAAARDCLGQSTGRKGLTALIGECHTRGWLTVEEVKSLRAGAKIRNSLAHPCLQTVFTVGMAAPMMASAHQAVSDLYRRSANPAEAGKPMSGL
jgi:hypothetical protein